jgi:phosphoserine phosphatase RsbU/P
MSSASLFPDFIPKTKIKRRTQGSRIRSLQLLNEAAQKFNAILDIDRLLEEVVSEVASMFGYRETSIWLIDGDEMVLAGVHGCSQYSKGSHRLVIGQQGMVGHVAASGKMRYAADVRLDPYYCECEPDILSEVDLPLIANGEVIGVFGAAQTELDAFPPEQLQFLQSLAHHISGAVHNARLFRRERAEKEEARAIQQALFPKVQPQLKGFSIDGRCIPAGAVGGDWYDYMPLPAHRTDSQRLWALVLADVSGKGMAAALLMSATRGIVRSLTETISSPAAVLTRLNRALIQDWPPEKFVTMVLAVLDPANRTLTIANGGHPWPIFVTGRKVEFLRSECGLPLGIAECEFDEHTIELPVGSRIVFYSDGITDAQNAGAKDYGLERLKRQSLWPDVSAKSILQDVQRFSGPQALFDDATVIVLKSE